MPGVPGYKCATQPVPGCIELLATKLSVKGYESPAICLLFNAFLTDICTPHLKDCIS